MTAAPATTRGGLLRGRWIDDWRPEDQGFWEGTGKKIANRNLWFSVFSEHHSQTSNYMHLLLCSTFSANTSKQLSVMSQKIQAPTSTCMVK